jgi:hypothetical protein
MKSLGVRIFALSATLASAMFAQNQRQATMVGGGGPDRGKCTIEVVVDNSAQVEIRGATATLRTLAGNPAQWRRFECTGAMPANPADFRFAGVDGRGRQELVRDPRNGGVAVVQIADSNGGSEGYTFDIYWGSGGSAFGNQPNYQERERAMGPDNQVYRDRDRNGYRDGDQYRPGYRDSEYYRRYGHGFGVDQAVRACEQSVQTQAARRFHTNDIHFGRTAIDDNPGRQDWVMGTLDVYRRNHEERFRFSCSVDFNTGRVRSAALDERPFAADQSRR